MRIAKASVLLVAGVLAFSGSQSIAADLTKEVLSAEQIAYVLAATKSVSGGFSKIDLPSVTFEVNSAELTPQARNQLDQMAKALNFPAFRDKPIRIAGHTDASGSAEYNAALSEQRAASVLRYLKDRHQVDAARMISQGLGESALRPELAPEHAEQRRVEFSLR